MLLSVRFQIDKVRIPRKFLQNSALGVFLSDDKVIMISVGHHYMFNPHYNSNRFPVVEIKAFLKYF